MITNEYRRTKEKYDLFRLPGTNALISDVIDSITEDQIMDKYSVSEKIELIGDIKMKYLKILQEQNPQQQKLFE